MSVTIIRIIFVLLFGIVGLLTGYAVDKGSWATLGCITGGLILGGGLVFLERSLEKTTLERFLAPAVGLILGLVMGKFLYEIIVSIPNLSITHNQTLEIVMPIVLMFIFGYMGLMIGISRRSGFETLTSSLLLTRRNGGIAPKILDTSVIIDGRIADIIATGFIEGSLVIPTFVLRELQNIADSADSLKRARGRRGLDILKMLQEGIRKDDVVVSELDFNDINEVDQKLVRLAKQVDGKILTNDFNLNKVAQIHGIEVFNINNLANAMKPAVLPDERMRVKIIKEGKEPGQGIGYLDDGTMIVVEEGRRLIGREIDVLVTSVLQTAAGRMIFTKVA